jgi:hypothetical protein
MNTPGKLRSLLSITQVLVFLPLLLWAVGCRTNAYNKSDVAGRSLHKAAAEVEIETRQIERTLTALQDLAERPAADLKPQFHRFSTALDRLIDSAEQTDRRGVLMEKKNAEYIAAWDQQVTSIHYGIIREQSEARKADVTNQFHAVNTRYRDLQAVVWPLIAYFKDIRTALSVDLTSAGLDSVKGIVSNADQNARKVQTALARLADELTTSGTGLSSVAPRDEPLRVRESTALVAP